MFKYKKILTIFVMGIMWLNYPQTALSTEVFPQNFYSVHNIIFSAMENKEEIWKDISGYEGIYQVSNYGRIKSLDREFISPHYNRKIFIKGKILVQRNSKQGYKRISLRKNRVLKTISIHRIVAEAFIPNPESKPQINHISGIKSDNSVWNLEWCTCSENLKHNYRVLGYPKPIIKRFYNYNHTNSKVVLKYDLDGNFLEEFGCCNDAAKSVGRKDGSLVSKVCREKTELAYGFRWKYKNKLSHATHIQNQICNRI